MLNTLSQFITSNKRDGTRYMPFAFIELGVAMLSSILNSEVVTLSPLMADPIILEVKFDNFLPEIIRGAVQLGNRRSTAFSKYAVCRMYG